MKNIIVVIYPAVKKITFVLESDSPTEDILEMVFARFNNGSGMECKEFIKASVRSLSVNDIVGVNGKLFQCLPMGWKEVSELYVSDLEDRVSKHPSFERFGSWFALEEEMRLE